MVGVKRRSRVILQVWMRGIHRHNPADHHRHLMYIHLGFSLGISPDDGKAPFLWVVTDREGSLSATVRQFSPRELLHVVEAGSKQPKIARHQKPPLKERARLDHLRWTPH